MSCKPVCKLCDKLVLSSSIVFSGGNLLVTIPAGSYNDGCKYCIVFAQAIPATVTINAPVLILIGNGPIPYPLVKCDCTPVVAAAIRTRTRYSVCVSTNATGGVFKILGKTCCTPENSLLSINGSLPIVVLDAPESFKAGAK